MGGVALAGYLERGKKKNGEWPNGNCTEGVEKETRKRTDTIRESDEAASKREKGKSDFEHKIATKDRSKGKKGKKKKKKKNSFRVAENDMKKKGGALPVKKRQIHILARVFCLRKVTGKRRDLGGEAR